MRLIVTPNVLLAVVIGVTAFMLFLPVSGGFAASRSATGTSATDADSHKTRPHAADSDICGRRSTRNCAKLVLAAQRVRSASTFGLTVHLESEKMPVEIAVAFPRGTAFANRGVRCSNALGQGCPRESRLGGGLGWWNVATSVGSFECNSDFPGSFKVWTRISN
jgi:hypothetical protein